MNIKKLRNFIVRNKNSILVISVILILLSLWFGSSIVEALRLLQLKSDLNNQIVERQQVSNQLDEDINQIGSQSYIERIARQYLELYYPNEEIVIPVENKIQAEISNKKTVEDSTQDEVDQEDLYVEEDTYVETYEEDPAVEEIYEDYNSYDSEEENYTEE